MPKVSPLQSDFSGGEVSPLFKGRVDSDQYKKCLETALNYIPTVQGAATRRPGTRFCSEGKFPSRKVVLIPFRYSDEQAYIIELGHQYVRFYKDNSAITNTPMTITAITQANPGVITVTSVGTLAVGNNVYIDSVGGMTTLNGRLFRVGAIVGNDFQLLDMDGNNFNTSALSAYTSGGTAAEIYELTNITSSYEYTEDDLFQVRFVQSADVLYMVHPNYATLALSRLSGHTSWSIIGVSFNDGPYLPTNTSSLTLTPSHTGGIIGRTVTASSGIFANTDVGRCIRIKHGSTWGWCTISGFTSSTLVSVSIYGDFGATTASTEWRLGLYSDTTGYPGTIQFHEDRVVLSGCPEAPERIDMSKTGGYDSTTFYFAPSDSSGNVASDNAVSVTANASDVNYTKWTTSDEKGLLVGTTGSEFVTRPSTAGEAITPTNISAKRATSYGSKDCNIVQIGKATLFVQKSGRKLREFIYFYDVDGFQSNDLTYIAGHILSSGVTQMAYQSEPHPLVWAVRTDGVVAAMSYVRDPDNLKVGWSRQILGGTSDAAGTHAVVESVAIIPSPDEDFDQVWLAVKRRINGRTVRYIEYMTAMFDDTTDQQDGVFLDCSLGYDSPIAITAATQANPVVITAASHGFNNGDTVVISDIEGMTELNTNIYTVANKTANTFELSGVDGTGYTTYVTGGEVRKRVTTVSGLWHLEGQTVNILGDGAVQASKTVSSGAITLSTPAAVVQVGYNYNSDLKLLRIEAGAADGTALGKTRRINRVGLLLHRTLGMKLGASFDDLNTITFRTTSDQMGHAPALFSGIVSETFSADYDFENQVCIRQDQPLPGTILAVMPQMTTQDR